MKSLKQCQEETRKQLRLLLEREGLANKEGSLALFDHFFTEATTQAYLLGLETAKEIVACKKGDHRALAENVALEEIETAVTQEISNLVE